MKQEASPDRAGSESLYVGSWPVLFNETIGFTIALIGVIRLFFIKNPPSMAD
jgi:hypothetical protein